ncbi:hemerythrin domain-containing protein [Sporosarcina sp. YIM B06819]|uniref:hemerythrin domain-containing protein n=1 Tax=Sporosarcina sp. YIM B06819 TaxID=3081769 RepID=UPI00298D312C|nr:hemerythrin domain-containing protein [Sporosarcina sp. YIM B06819]
MTASNSVPKSGPALKQLSSHHAIHEGGLAGAIDKTNDMMDYLKKGDLETANKAADALVDYWTTRIIAHADSEEAGFYDEVATKKPELRDTVIQLTRDHDLMRIIVKDIGELRATENLSPAVLHRFHSLLVVNEIHSRDEERLLF